MLAPDTPPERRDRSLEELRDRSPGELWSSTVRFAAAGWV